VPRGASMDDGLDDGQHGQGSQGSRHLTSAGEPSRQAGDRAAVPFSMTELEPHDGLQRP
jgi:hypothetical protein